jgi:hypothetical protein
MQQRMKVIAGLNAPNLMPWHLPRVFPSKLRPTSAILEQIKTELYPLMLLKSQNHLVFSLISSALTSRGLRTCLRLKAKS